MGIQTRIKKGFNLRAEKEGGGVHQVFQGKRGEKQAAYKVAKWTKKLHDRKNKTEKGSAFPWLNWKVKIK